MTGDLFGEHAPASSRMDPRSLPDTPGMTRPLAERLRPTTLDDVLGQDELVGPDAPLRRLIEADRIPSMIFWGPPGSGKTTLATVLARVTQSDFVTLSAVSASIKDVRSVVDAARHNRQYARRTILFIDEIHRFNKAQQDAFLPHVESGLLTIIGATTENPSFSVISALLSRCRVFVLRALDTSHLGTLVRRALDTLRESGTDVAIEDDALRAIVQSSDGDGRRALGIVEIVVDALIARGDKPLVVRRSDVESIVQRHLAYDRAGEEHYNLISALHKTIRSSDPHGAIYWCQRMIAAGEDPRFLLRRLMRMASEDVGLADPSALSQAVAAMRAYESVGSPEGDLFILQLAVALALAPKSNAIYRAAGAVSRRIGETGALPVPLHLRNAPTRLMKDIGYGREYTYDHDAEGHFIAKQGLPDDLAGERYYEPSDQGREATLRQRLAELDRLRDEASRNDE